MPTQTSPQYRLYWTYPLPCLALLLIILGFIICINGIGFVQHISSIEEPLPQEGWIAAPIYAGEFIMALGIVVLVLAYHTVKRDQQVTYWAAKNAGQGNPSAAEKLDSNNTTQETEL